jgi:hypothetical protein
MLDAGNGYVVGSGQADVRRAVKGIFPAHRPITVRVPQLGATGYLADPFAWHVLDVLVAARES